MNSKAKKCEIRDIGGTVCGPNAVLDDFLLPTPTLHHNKPITKIPKSFLYGWRVFKKDLI